MKMERWDRKFFFPMTEKKKGLKNAGNLKQGINWQTYADKKYLPGIKKQNGTNRARPPDTGNTGFPLKNGCGLQYLVL